MDIVTALALMLCGILAAATLIVKTKPNAKELINQLAPIQGIVGVVVCLWGIWTVISCVIHVRILVHFMFYFIVFLATGVVEVLLGFLLGYALIAQYALGGSAEAQAKGKALQEKLVVFQVPLGLGGIALGLLLLILHFGH